MLRNRVLFAVTLAVITLTLFARAQTQTAAASIADTNGNGQPSRAQIISEALDLSKNDAAAFWPIYDQYEGERSTLSDRRIALLKEYQQKYLTMSDDEAKSMANRMFEYDSGAMEVNRKYFKRFGKVLPTYTVAKFFEVEHRIDLVMELKASPSLPPLPDLDQEKGQN